MDAPEIAELKELMRQNIAITQETNKMVRGMRNASRLKSLMFWLIAIASIALSVWSYYYFVAPRIGQITNFYNTTLAPLQGAGSSINDLIKNFGKQATTTP